MNEKEEWVNDWLPDCLTDNTCGWNMCGECWIEWNSTVSQLDRFIYILFFGWCYSTDIFGEMEKIGYGTVRTTFILIPLPH